MKTILECKNLTKRYGRTQALSGINLSLKAGRIIGLLGPNGSGKTTMIKLINGLLTPTEGEILIDGMAPGVKTKSIVSYLPERTYLDESMRITEAIDYFEDFYKDFDRKKAMKMLEKSKSESGPPHQNLIQGQQRKSAAHPGHEPPGKALLSRRAHRRRGPGCQRLHFKYYYQ